MCVALISGGPVAKSANSYRGEKTVSLGVGYHSFNQSALAEVGFTYRFSTYFRLAPSVQYVFRRHNEDAMQINLNAEVPLPVAARCDIYPLAGLCYTSWNHHGTLLNPDNNRDVGTRTSRLGINAGAGFNIRFPGALRLGASAGYTFVKGYHGAFVAARIAYAF